MPLKTSASSSSSEDSKELGLQRTESVAEDDADDGPFQEVQRLVFELQHQITETSNANFELEKDVRFFDARIGLLISHRITLEEFMQHYKTFFSGYGGGRSNSGVDRSRSVESLRQPKPSLALQNYGVLLYVLQTQPHLLAEIIWLVSQSSLKGRDVDALMQIVMVTIYGHDFDSREEHLLLCMFEQALMLEFGASEDVHGLLRADSAVTRMMTMYSQRGPGVQYLHQVLSDAITEVMSIDESLEINPVKVFRELAKLGKVEDMPALQEEEALQNADVQLIINNRVSRLQDLTKGLLTEILASVDAVPYGIRWLCHLIQKLVDEYFPGTKRETVYSLIGGFFFLRYVNPNIVSPELCRIVEITPRPNSRRILTLVAKILQRAANKSKGTKEEYMHVFNSFVATHKNELQRFIAEMCDVPGFHDQMEVEHLIAFSKGDVQMEVSIDELCILQKALSEHSDGMKKTEQSSQLFEVLNDIDSPLVHNYETDRKVVLKLFSRWADIPNLSASQPCDNHVEVQSTKKHCHLLLSQLYRLIPDIVTRPSLRDAIELAQQSPPMHVSHQVSLAVNSLEASVKKLPSSDVGQQIFEDMKKSLPCSNHLYKQYRKELCTLRKISTVVSKRNDWLNRQLSLYKAYLEAVRTKAAVDYGKHHYRTPTQSQKCSSSIKLTLNQLVKDSIALPTDGLSNLRHRDVYVSLSTSSPGAYRIQVFCRGQPEELVSQSCQLEELLELRQRPDAKLDLGRYISLDVEGALLLISKHFIRR